MLLRTISMLSKNLTARRDNYVRGLPDATNDLASSSNLQ
jgi:hypothetical protein